MLCRARCSEGLWGSSSLRQKFCRNRMPRVNLLRLQGTQSGGRPFEEWCSIYKHTYHTHTHTHLHTLYATVKMSRSGPSRSRPAVAEETNWARKEVGRTIKSIKGRKASQDIRKRVCHTLVSGRLCWALEGQILDCVLPSWSAA